MNYLEQPMRQYLEDAASGQPTPGGGSVSCLAGACGITMAEMAANFTLGRDKFKDVEAEVTELLADLGEARTKLLGLMEEDMAAYGQVSAAYALPRQTDEQKTARTQAIQEALGQALAVPLEAMRVAVAVLTANRRLLTVANPNLISDVGVAAELLLGALRGARLNVDVNLAYLKDEELVSRSHQEADALERRGQRFHDDVVGLVMSKLSHS